MKTVYLLGAGASRQLKFTTGTVTERETIHRCHNLNGPLSRGFFYDAAQFSRSMKRHFFQTPDFFISREWLANFIKQQYAIQDINEIYDKKEVSDLINIEELYLRIEGELDKYSGLGALTEENLEQHKKLLNAWIGGRSALIEYVYKVLSDINYFIGVNIYHEIFAKEVLSDESTVISFNWDILLEEALYKTGKWCYGDGYGFKPRAFIDKTWDKTFKVRGGSKSLVLKPHGSINWYRRMEHLPAPSEKLEDLCIGIPLEKFRGGTMPAQGGLNFHEYYPEENGEMLEPMIIPPAKKRNLLPAIWEEIRAALGSADRIIAIGFAVNDYDHHLREELKGIKLKDGVTILILNPAVDVALIERYKNLFPGAKIEPHAIGFGDYCEGLAKKLDMETLLEMAENVRVD